jgi:hypothetical protein
MARPGVAEVAVRGLALADRARQLFLKVLGREK